MTRMNTNKVNLTLYVDKNLVEKARNIGINLSVFFEKRLQELLNNLNLEGEYMQRKSRRLWNYENAFGKLCEKILEKLMREINSGKIPSEIVFDRNDLEELLIQANKEGINWLNKYDEDKKRQHLVDTGKEIIVRFKKYRKGVSYSPGERYRHEFGEMGRASYNNATITIPLDTIRDLFT